MRANHMKTLNYDTSLAPIADEQKRLIRVLYYYFPDAKTASRCTDTVWYDPATGYIFRHMVELSGKTIQWLKSTEPLL